MLDGILGGVAGMVPGGQMLGLVAMGVELAKGLFDKGDMQGTQDMLKFLNEVVNKLTQPAGGSGEPQPFTSPKSAAAGQPANASHQSIDITIEMKPGSAGAQPVSYGRLPEVDGSPAGDKRLSEQASPRVDGNSANRDRALAPGSPEWLTVMCAMQQNPNVRYNADTQQFTLKMSDGSDRNLCSLQEAKNVAGADHFDRNNPVGAPKLGEFLSQRASQPHDLQNLVQELKKLLKQFEEAQQMMQKSTVDITVNQAVA